MKLQAPNINSGGAQNWSLVFEVSLELLFPHPNLLPAREGNSRSSKLVKAYLSPAGRDAREAAVRAEYLASIKSRFQAKANAFEAWLLELPWGSVIGAWSFRRV